MSVKENTGVFQNKIIKKEDHMKKNEILECLSEIFKIEIQNHFVINDDKIIMNLADGTKATIRLKEIK